MYERRMSQAPPKSFRRTLAEATAPEHEALHTHPWISRLAEPDLARPSYEVILGGYREFLTCAETVRQTLDVYAEFSLADPLSALDEDLAHWKPDPTVPPRPCLGFADSGTAMLGVLYVLHGSGFGASILARQVRQALPGISTAFLGAGTPTGLWRALVQAFEEQARDPSDQRAIISAARSTFCRFGSHMSEYCEWYAVRNHLPSLRVRRVHGALRPA